MVLFNSFVYLTDNEAENMIFSKYGLLLCPAVTFYLIALLQSLANASGTGEANHTAYIDARKRYTS